MPSTLQLVCAQQERWPDSKFLTWEDLANLCRIRRSDSTNLDGSPIDWDARIERYRAAHPDAVPYMVKADGGYKVLGIRYGIDGPQYISGFPQGEKVK